jgi:hypothetical protein
LDDGIRAAAQLCHYIVITLEPHRAAIALAQSLGAELELLNIPRANIGFALLNRASVTASLSRAAAETMLPGPIVGSIAPASELAFQSIENSTPMVILQPDSLPSTQIRELAHHIPRRPT